MKNRVVLLLVVFTLLAPSLFAAGARESDEQVTVTIWFGREDFIPRDRFAALAETYPHITVQAEVVPLEDAATEFMRYHAAGLGPDVFQTFQTMVEVLDGRNMLYDMSSYFERWQQEDPEDFDDLIPIALDAATTSRGRIVGINMVGGALGMVYRKDWFDQLGLSAPLTQDDVINAGIRLRDSGLLSPAQGQYPIALIGGRQPSEIWVKDRFWLLGGSHTESGLPIIDSDPGVQLIEFYQTVMRESLVDPEVIAWGAGQKRGAFIGGSAAMVEGIGWHVMTAMQQELQYGVNWAVVPAGSPYREGAEDEASLYMDTYPYYVSSNTQNPEAVFRVLQYLAESEISKEVGLRYQPAARLSFMQDNEVLQRSPWIADMIDAAMASQVPPIHDRQDEVHVILIDMMQEALQNPNADPRQIAAKYQQRLNSLD